MPNPDGTVTQEQDEQQLQLLYLMATLKDGTKLLARFDRMKGSGEGYATSIFARQKAFNAWKVVGNVHPISGEPVLLRTRQMVSGDQIAMISPVVPKAGREEDHGFDPDAFEPKVEVQSGKYGSWISSGIEGVPDGTRFPVSRDEGEGSDLRRYVILRIGTGENREGERRHYIDQEQTVTHETIDSLTGPMNTSVERAEPGDGDDDIDPFTRG